jgi:hypothetical protein
MGIQDLCSRHMDEMESKSKSITNAGVERHTALQTLVSGKYSVFFSCEMVYICNN